MTRGGDRNVRVCPRCDTQYPLSVRRCPNQCRTGTARQRPQPRDGRDEQGLISGIRQPKENR